MSDMCLWTMEKHITLGKDLPLKESLDRWETEAAHWPLQRKRANRLSDAQQLGANHRSTSLPLSWRKLARIHAEMTRCFLCFVPAFLKKHSHSVNLASLKGCYEQHHSQVLPSIVSILENKWAATNSQPPAASNPWQTISLSPRGQR